MGDLSGRDTLKQMNRSLRSARRDLDRLDRELRVTSEALAKNAELESRALKQLAAIRLDAVQKGELDAELDAADRRVRDILDRRERALADLAADLERAQSALYELEDRREEVHETVDAAAATLAEREAAVQRSLDEDAAFIAQLERTRQADAIAAKAAEKAALAVEDRQEKGRPYEADELFMYLWRRNYGTSGYRANPLTRMLDAWVARRCNYADARPNYWMLLEIPRRLKAHAEDAEASASQELDRLREVEEQAAVRGGVTEAKDALAASEAEQDALDDEIAAAEQRVGELKAAGGRYAAGLDEHMEQALEVYAFVFDKTEIGNLANVTRATLSAEDDAIVADLDNLRRNEAELREELDENRVRHDEHRRRVAELEKVRRDFKRSRYDDAHSRFDRGDMIERMIGEVVAGVVRGGTLWDVLRRYQHYTDLAGEWPDFGSGGIVVPKRRRGGGKRRPGDGGHQVPTWHWPGPSRGSGGFRIPRRPSGGSRGRSRGGSRGGGFRTGGGV